MIPWNGLKYFKPDSTIDKWGNPDKIDHFLVQHLENFRESVGSPVIVTSGYREGDLGQHGLGRAVDIVCPNFGGSLFDLYLLSERFGFNGIGIYRDWVYDGRRIGGLHLDTRDVKSGEFNGVGSRWVCVRPGAVDAKSVQEIMAIKQVYRSMTVHVLKEEGII